MVKLRNADNDADVSSITVRVTVTNGQLVISGDNVVDNSGKKINFRVASNHEAGLEYMNSAENTGALASKGTVIPLSTAAEETDLFAYVTGTYQIQSRANKDAAWSNVEGMFLHAADGIAIDAQQ